MQQGPEGQYFVNHKWHWMDGCEQHTPVDTSNLSEIFQNGARAFFGEDYYWNVDRMLTSKDDLFSLCQYKAEGEGHHVITNFHLADAVLTEEEILRETEAETDKERVKDLFRRFADDNDPLGRGAAKGLGIRKKGMLFKAFGEDSVVVHVETGAILYSPKLS